MKTNSLLNAYHVLTFWNNVCAIPGAIHLHLQVVSLVKSFPFPPRRSCSVCWLSACLGPLDLNRGHGFLLSSDGWAASDLEHYNHHSSLVHCRVLVSWLVDALSPLAISLILTYEHTFKNDFCSHSSLSVDIIERWIKLWNKCKTIFLIQGLNEGGG